VPGVRFTGRRPTDPLGQLLAETKAVDGGGAQDANRWGDYTSLAVDPADDCTFWFTTEYLPFRGAFNWDTQIVPFRVGTCP
jgi:hypothetical protein